MKKFLMAVFSVMLIVMLMPIHASATAVDMELVLAVDVSGSIDSTEYNLQRQGYVNAFNNVASLFNDPNLQVGAFAVTMVYWSSDQVQKTNWYLIDSAADATAFATLISGLSRTPPAADMTAVGEAIDFSNSLFDGNGYEGSRLVIDISGDGSNNYGSISVNSAVSAAVADGIKINAVAILGSESGLETWYRTNVTNPTGGFTIAATGFDTFGDAIDRKITAEVINQPVPEPATMLLLGLGIAGLAGVRRKFQK